MVDSVGKISHYYFSLSSSLSPLIGGSLPEPLPKVVISGSLPIVSAANLAFASADKVTVSAVEGAFVVVVLV
jgi:hypothetical protein